MAQIDSETIPRDLKFLQEAMEDQGIEKLKILLEVKKDILKPIHCRVGYYGDTVMFGLQREYEDVVINPICFPSELGSANYETGPKMAMSLPQEIVMQMLNNDYSGYSAWIQKENATEIPHYLEKLKMLIENGADLTTPSNVAYVYRADYAERQWTGGYAISPIEWFKKYSNREVVALLENAIRREKELAPSNETQKANGANGVVKANQNNIADLTISIKSNQR